MAISRNPSARLSSLTRMGKAISILDRINLERLIDVGDIERVTHHARNTIVASMTKCGETCGLHCGGDKFARPNATAFPKMIGSAANQFACASDNGSAVSDFAGDCGPKSSGECEQPQPS
ncbi:hypothetical protein LBMAG52_06410 [Planctomycetia bacterium]|nr:hypothetical protein LBMAG52_06410 [Planctomycetia bacterium]